jgi:hypothetical protein
VTSCAIAIGHTGSWNVARAALARVKARLRLTRLSTMADGCCRAVAIVHGRNGLQLLQEGTGDDQ